MQLRRLAVALCFIGLISGCSRNGIEGNAQYFGINKNAAGVKLEAKTNTDIKEEQSKASFTVTTDSNGHFKIKGLLPNKGYQLTSIDPRFDSGTIYEDAPEKGTKIIKAPFVVCPIPPGPGIWLFDGNSAEFKRILEITEDSKKKVPIRVHEGMVGGGFGNTSAFSIAEENIKSVAASLPRTGLLVIAGGGISDIGQLFKQPKQVLARTAIPDGWYYNIQRFYEEDFMIVGNKMLKIQVQKPKLEEAYKSATGKRSIWAYPLNSFSPGLYIFTTNIASGQRSSQVLFGESHPQEGFVIKID